MAFKMKGFPLQDTTDRKLRKAQNKAARQADRQYKKTERQVQPYVKGTKTNKEVLDRLADPNTETRYKKKQQLKAMAGLAALGTGIAKLFKNSPQLLNRWTRD
tara:strand:- start:235 stop:543 length:309 start_codon:yes stop_codon:yes gene_type:complete